jgi:hypothetical protein
VDTVKSGRAMGPTRKMRKPEASKTVKTTQALRRSKTPTGSATRAPGIFTCKRARSSWAQQQLITPAKALEEQTRPG